jgi:alanine racemase
MDMLGVDVTDIIADHGPVNLGDPVELWGKQLDVREVAEHIGTIAYELVAALSPRVERVYLGETD